MKLAPRNFAQDSAEGRQHAQTIARLVLRSLHAELALYPKPGLVSHCDSGAHRDMDAGTFVRSLFSLRGYFAEIAAAGMRDARLGELQQIGLRAERRMLQSTQGINTHRGAIFSLGLLAAAAGLAWARGRECSDETLRKLIVTRWGRDLRLAVVAPLPVASHGQQVASRYAVAGARGEAVHGFPAVFDVGLPQLRSALDQGAGADEALVHVFFSLLANVADTNVLFRAGANGLHFLQREAHAFLASGSVFADGWFAHAEALHRHCIRKNLSPGGCADLLAATWFVHQLQRLNL